ncbi:BZ3500_MvSof-1268-A1-R1_Chr4-1g06815 [Microbotryum saponariae]|uniref:BZ3500_MvSof-1268-A1-R1_Chr4-1g06815 protein n=1 Tax=Microbotryum saponariae TaxID=289078 RepID=A0A2X0KSM8_9BASI|nr:BZ3500_MvSof-1268-A1-R1_Chr4-1g06815 [Microbotryum saponariae]SDA06472.1 BZ3501_MvSof-1269-A2-R1_Chr4-1g06517 [Microbotryum saponariae]
MDDDNPFMRTFVPQLPGSALHQQLQLQQQRGYRFAHSSSKRDRSTSPISSTSSSTSPSRAPSEAPLEDPLDWGGDVTLDRERSHADDPEGGDTATFSALQEHNVGMKMLLRLGWTKGKGLGKEGQGRLVPIDPTATGNLLGIGKAALDTRMLEASSNLSSRPRELESQRIAKETPDQREARLAKAKFEEKVKNEVAETLRKFNCDICNKSYTTVGQYDEHTNSYDHHHRARAVATKQMQLDRAKANGEADKRREKERKREEKEMRKLMEKAGVKVPLANVVHVTATAPVVVEAKKVEEVKKSGAGGWAKFGGGRFAPVGPSSSSLVTSTSTPTSSSFKPVGGFAPIASTSMATSSPKPERYDSSLAPKASGWSSIAPSTAPTSSHNAHVPAKSARITAPPRFRAGGTIEPSPVFDAAAPMTTAPRPPRDLPPPPPPPPSVPLGRPLPPSVAPPPPPSPPPNAITTTVSKPRWNVLPSSAPPRMPAYDAPPPPPPPPSNPPTNPGSRSPFQTSPCSTSAPSSSFGGGFKPADMASSSSAAPPSNRGGFGSGPQRSFKASFKPIPKR